MAQSQQADHPASVWARSRRASKGWSPRTATAFGVAFAATLAVALLQGPKIFYFDSGNYWALGETFVRHGDFSLTNFNSPLRGYLLPLINHGLQGLADVLGWSPSTSAKLFNAFTFSLVGAMLAPRLAEICFPQIRWCVLRRLGLVALLAIFWSGYLNFPLSDFPALVMVLMALIAIARAEAPGWMLVAGIATGVAIDVRPSYVLLAPIMLVLMIWAWFERRGDGTFHSFPRRVLCLGLLVAGFATISAPQSLSAHRYYRTWSFVPGAAAHLESLQLTEGLRLQRVGGYVGAGHPPLMAYEDEAGRRLLYEQKEHSITGLSQYLGLVLDHPVTMVGVFARHVINGLDQRYSTPYVEHLESPSYWLLRLTGLLLVFLGLLRVLWPAARRSLGVTHWRYLVGLLVSCATAVPSAMETRYMLPVYLLSYILVLAPGWPNPIVGTAAGIRRYGTLVTIGLVYALYMAVVWYVVSGATSHLHFV